MKKGIIISDLHCGHRTGLTPPGYQYKDGGWQAKYSKVQKACWNWYKDTLKKIGDIDVLIVNGDAIDGKGYRSGSSEQITTDMMVQADIAVNCIATAMQRKTKLVMTRGTPYHTGEGEDFEDLIAQELKAEEIGAHVFPKIDGVVFDLKHKVGSSTIPHGRSSAIKKAALWNKIWAEADEQPDADVLVRSHVHYHQASYDPDFGWQMTTPALQGFGSKYGSLQCEGRVHFGLIEFVCDKGKFGFTDHIAKLPVHKSKVVEL